MVKKVNKVLRNEKFGDGILRECERGENEGK